MVVADIPIKRTTLNRTIRILLLLLKMEHLRPLSIIRYLHRAGPKYNWPKDCRGILKGAMDLWFSKSKDFRPEVDLYNFHTGERMTNLDVGW